MQHGNLTGGLVLSFFLAALGHAQTCTLLGDINQIATPNSSDPAGFPLPGIWEEKAPFVQLGNFWLLTAETAETGSELWRTDGTAAGTVLVADINPGPDDSHPADLVRLGNEAFFRASSPGSGAELWKSDGTAAGTVLVKDIEPGSADSWPNDLIVLNGRVCFEAVTSTSGREPWVSDGTALGTQMLLDIDPGTPHGEFEYPGLNASGLHVLFAARDPVHGPELWSTDGTPAGTHLVADIEPGPVGTTPHQFVAMGGATYFEAATLALGHELWRTDGTAAGTHVVKDIGPGVQDGLTPWLPNSLAAYGGFLYFNGNDGLGQRLWRTDGTAAGTVLARDAAGGLVGEYPKSLQISAGQLFFAAYTMAEGGELWRVSGGSIQLVRDLVPGPGFGLVPYPELTDAGGHLVFIGQSPQVGREVFVSDGTSAGTGPLGDAEKGPGSSSPANLTPTGPGALLCSNSARGVGRELWRLTGATTSLVKDISPGKTTATSDPLQSFVHAGSTLYLSANDGLHGDEPWMWDAQGGLALLADLEPGVSISSPKVFFDAWIGDHQVTFFSAKGINGRALWRTDGTPAGTQLVVEGAPGAGDLYPQPLACDGQRLFFHGRTDAEGWELWVSDGTPGGTQLLKDIRPGPKTSAVSDLVNFQGKIFFAADDGQSGSELWSSDGTAAGTQMVVDIDPNGSSLPDYLAVVGERLFFSAHGPQLGNELWVTDGTVAGTQIVSDINPGGASSWPEDLAVMGGALHFTATEPTFGRELWRVDATTLAAQLVADVEPGPASGEFKSLTPAGKRFFFSAKTLATGRELWVSDGQTAGTHLVTEFGAGAEDGLAHDPQLLPAGGGVYFGAGTLTDAGDVELTFSDGSATGTQRVCDLNPGSSGSGPRDLRLVDGRLIFAASSPVFGRELFTVAAPGAYVQDLGPASAPQRLDATEPHLGGTSQIDIVGIAPGGLGYLLMSAPAAAQASPLVQFGNASWIDPASALLLQIFASPTASMSQPIPASPSLAGLAVHVQVWSSASGAPAATTSNGLRLVLDL